MTKWIENHYWEYKALPEHVNKFWRIIFSVFVTVGLCVFPTVIALKIL